MTEQQRKAIEILNSLHSPMYLSEEKALEDDDYFFLLSFIIDRPQEIHIPQPYPVIPQQWPPEPIQPYYGNRFNVTCDQKEDDLYEEAMAKKQSIENHKRRVGYEQLSTDQTESTESDS